MRFCIPYNTFGRSFSHFAIPYFVFERSFSLFFSTFSLFERATKRSRSLLCSIVTCKLLKIQGTKNAQTCATKLAGAWHSRFFLAWACDCAVARLRQRPPPPCSPPPPPTHTHTLSGAARAREPKKTQNKKSMYTNSRSTASAAVML